MHGSAATAISNRNTSWGMVECMHCVANAAHPQCTRSAHPVHRLSQRGRPPKQTSAQPPSLPRLPRGQTAPPHIPSAHQFFAPKMEDAALRVTRVELPNALVLEQVEQSCRTDDDQYSCDGRVWECGVIVSYCLRPAGPSLLPLGDAAAAPVGGRVVLDLGTGTGVCGLAIAKAYCPGPVARVLLTDMAPALANAARSVARNFPDGAPDVVRLRAMDWADPQSFGPVVEEVRAVPHLSVVASDLVYSRAEVGPLLRVVAALVRGRTRPPEGAGPGGGGGGGAPGGGGGSTEFLFCLQLRRAVANRVAMAEFVVGLLEAVAGAAAAPDAAAAPGPGAGGRFGARGGGLFSAFDAAPEDFAREGLVRGTLRELPGPLPTPPGAAEGPATGEAPFVWTCGGWTVTELRWRALLQEALPAAVEKKAGEAVFLLRLHRAAPAAVA